MRMLKSRAGEVMSEQDWRDWIDGFWAYAEKQNSDKKCYRFVKPADYFERIVKILGLKELPSWKGVF
jgi:hypothetical protein